MPAKPRILIVEDEAAIKTGLVDVFVFHGYDVEGVDNGIEGLEKALSGQFDLVLLDVMLPRMDGFEVCNRIRSEDRDTAIIMLTAKSNDEDIIHGLTQGADDYVAKPFSVAQLVLRVEAVLRRTGAERKDTLSLDGGEIDCTNLSGRFGDRDVVFTRREIDILQFLHQHAGRPVSRDELLTRVWGYAKNLFLETRTVDIHIAKLRRKIEADPGNPRHLVTVRGAGYRLNC